MGDVDAVLAFLDNGAREWARPAVLDSRVLIAQVGEEIVGLRVHGDFFGFAFLELLVVAETHRRRGIGTALVRGWERQARSPKLFTSTNQSNIPMQRLCERLGYVRSGVIENLVDPPDPELIYFKPKRSIAPSA